MLRYFSSISLFILTICFLNNSVAREAIVNGHKAREHQFPYQVSFQIEHESACGAGIISERFVITAAHCVQYSDGRFINKHMSILAGTNNFHVIGPHTERINVAKLYVLKVYKKDTSINDIAVLKLEHPLKLSEYVKKLKLPKHDHDVNKVETAVIAGFGWNTAKLDSNYQPIGNNSDGHLRFGEVDILKKEDDGYFVFTDEERHICARTRQHGKLRGVCRGDSGSPLVHDNTVIGILTLGQPECSEAYYGAVYTRVSHYVNFINDAMHDRVHDIDVHEFIHT